MIYLDYNATTPIAREVADAMLPFIHGNHGNPSSSHELGVTAKKAVEEARAQVAALISCLPEEIMFTSGGSESNNTVIKGVAFTLKDKGNHVITSQVEHPSVAMPCDYLERTGLRVSRVPVDEYGVVKVVELERLIEPTTILVTIMHSNNETGTLQPLGEISEICRRHGVLLHTDASQSVGKVPVDVNEPAVDFLTIAGHKLYAPKGIGALFIRKGTSIEPLIHGAGHESGRRAGTENVIFQVALGTASKIAIEAVKNDEIRLLTRYFHGALKERFGTLIALNGHPEKRLPNTLNVSFMGYDGHEILRNLGDVAASTGSACHSGLTSISPVLKAMGVTEEAGRGAVRFSLGRYTTKDEIDMVIDRIESSLPPPTPARSMNERQEHPEG